MGTSLSTLLGAGVMNNTFCLGIFLILVYLRQMRSRSALPLLEQMIAWFDMSNVVYCVAFLAHVWLFDEALPLRIGTQLRKAWSRASTSTSAFATASAS
jgi:hypothetical protein